MYFVHGVGDVFFDPILTAGDDLLAGDFTSVGRLAISGAVAIAVAVFVALLGDVRGRTSLDVIVGHVAAIGGLVPDAITLDVLTRSLAGYRDFGALVVDLDDVIGSARARAAIHAAAADWVGADSSR